MLHVYVDVHVHAGKLRHAYKLTFGWMVYILVAYATLYLCVGMYAGAIDAIHHPDCQQVYTGKPQPPKTTQCTCTCTGPFVLAGLLATYKLHPLYR